jgi:hypothetical protein
MNIIHELFKKIHELFMIISQGQWFWRRRFLNDPTPILHFCDYLTFEDDLALYMNNLESPLPKDDLY